MPIKLNPVSPLGERLKHWRSEAGVLQRVVRAKLGDGFSSLGGWEVNILPRNPKQKLQALADYYWSILNCNNRGAEHTPTEIFDDLMDAFRRSTNEEHPGLFTKEDEEEPVYSADDLFEELRCIHEKIEGLEANMTKLHKRVKNQGEILIEAERRLQNAINICRPAQIAPRPFPNLPNPTLHCTPGPNLKIVTTAGEAEQGCADYTQPPPNNAGRKD